MAPILDEIRVNDRFPLIVVEFSGAPSDDEFARYIQEMESIIDKRAATPSRITPRTVVLIDTTHSTRPVTARQRRMQADHVARIQQKYPTDASAERCAAVCFVITNILIRGVLTAIMWLQPMRDRFKVCATRAEADAWSRSWIVGTWVASEPPAAISR